LHFVCERRTHYCRTRIDIDRPLTSVDLVWLSETAPPLALHLLLLELGERSLEEAAQELVVALPAGRRFLSELEKRDHVLSKAASIS
jgi:hypothetical protein